MTARITQREALEAKIDAAFTYIIDANLVSSISITKICKQAGVNRSNLYEHYPDLVQKLNNEIAALKAKDVPINKLNKHNVSTRIELVRENQALKLKLKALEYLCIELQTALNDAKRSIQQISKARAKKKLAMRKKT